MATAVLMEKFRRLAALSVRDVAGNAVPFKSLYEPNGAVVVLVRRMG
jgi:hypothetical protein